MIKFLIHACEQVLRFTQVSKWDDLSEEIKVQLGFNMGVVALGLNLSKEEGFLVLSNTREDIISMKEFQEHMKSLVNSHKINVDPIQITRKF